MTFSTNSIIVCHLFADSKGFHIDEGLFLAHPDLIPLATLRKKRNIALLLPLLKEAVGYLLGTFWQVCAFLSNVVRGFWVTTTKRPSFSI